MEMECENTMVFDMGSLRSTLPLKKRGLSRYYTGKSRSFTCVRDVASVEDLKKADRVDVDAKRKKHSHNHNNEHLRNVDVPVPFACPRVSSNNLCCVGV